MHHTSLVLHLAGTDCDGTTFAAARINVPMHRALELAANVHALATFAVASEQLSSYEADGATHVQTMPDFLRSFTDWSDAEHYAEFCGAPQLCEGFTGPDSRYMVPGLAYIILGANWNPWVHDDTIGIPALDSRLDD